MAKTDFIVNFIRKVISEEKEKDSILQTKETSNRNA